MVVPNSESSMSHLIDAQLGFVVRRSSAQPFDEGSARIFVRASPGRTAKSEKSRKTGELKKHISESGGLGQTKRVKQRSVGVGLKVGCTARQERNMMEKEGNRNGERWRVDK